MLPELNGLGESGSMTPRERMLSACRGEPVDRPPVWLMRQAGRYLPEYREIRAETSFLERAGDAETATEISLQPHRRFHVDGVVVFSDILLPLLDAGLQLRFDPGPIVANPIRGESDLARLDCSVQTSMRPTCDAIRALKKALGDDAAVIGFAGAPWTLAAYALEERLSRDVVTLGALSYREPELVDRLLERMVALSAETLELQIEAGADVLQLFDTWAGMLDRPRFRRFAGRALRGVIERLPRERPPVIVFARGAAHLLDDLADLGADVVSLDWRSPLAEAAERVGDRVSLQGNLDPAALHAAPGDIARQVRDMIAAGRKARGHVVNLGHGIQEKTPVESVAAFVAAARGERL
jgi:uroporphyrinogen decarboxylase